MEVTIPWAAATEQSLTGIATTRLTLLVLRQQQQGQQ